MSRRDHSTCTTACAHPACLPTDARQAGFIPNLRRMIDRLTGRYMSYSSSFQVPYEPINNAVIITSWTYRNSCPKPLSPQDSCSPFLPSLSRAFSYSLLGDGAQQKFLYHCSVVTLHHTTVAVVYDPFVPIFLYFLAGYRVPCRPRPV